MKDWQQIFVRLSHLTFQTAAKESVEVHSSHGRDHFECTVLFKDLFECGMCGS